MVGQWKSVANLTLGVNYRNLVASRTSLPGEAQDALNVWPREDGGIYKSFGWLRRNPTALTGKPLACKGFSYRGKNTEGGDTRAGNLGIPNKVGDADFTRREEEYPGFLVLTATTAYIWDPETKAFIEVNPSTQPQGFVVQPETKPSIEIVQDNCYVVGWATVNLRFDPVDRLWYQWGWEEVPAAPTLTPIAGDLIGGATYEYGVSFQDNYTGEESKMSDAVAIKIPSGGGGVQVDASAADYTGDRHHVNDVSLVVWRTGADDKSPRFLDLLLPELAADNIVADDGLARETSLRPFQGTQADEPRLSSLKLFKGRFYGLSKSENSHRVYFSHFDKSNFFERWRILDFRDLEVPEGEVLTSIGGTDTTMLVYSQRGCFRGSVSVSSTRMTVGFQRMPWHVGAVGPRARFTVDGWEYFLSERGPFRWKEGLTAPQNIGENLLPIFVDPTSGLCKLNPVGKEKSEVNYDWTTNMVVWTFALGDAEDVNTHIRYWIEAQRINSDYTFGWFPASPDIQAMDLSSALVGFDGGFPESPREKKQEIIWCDSLGYVYEYQLGAKRGGLDAAEVARTTAVDPITATQITVDDTLFTTGDGLTGLRLEIESQPDSNGDTTTEVYTIDSNTANTIDAAFTRTPVAGDAVRIAGIPAFWRSWFDHFGQPHQHKTMMDFSLGYQDRNNPDGTIDIGIGSGEFPTTFSRVSSAGMGKYRKKFTVSKTAVFFMYEFSNSFPDELFLITDFDREIELVAARRKA